MAEPEAAPLHPLVELAGPPAFARPPATLTAVARLEEIARVATGPVDPSGPGGGRPSGADAPTMVIVPREALDRVAHYELDVAVRLAADSGVVALVLVGRLGVPSTVRQLADRTGVRVFGCEPDVSIVSLVRVLDRMIEVEHHPSLERARHLRDLLRGPLAEAEPDEIVAAAERVLLTPLELRWLGPASPGGEPVVVGGHPIGAVHAGPRADAGTTLVLPAVASAIALRLEQRWRAVERMSEILAAVIHATGDTQRFADNRARLAGVPLQDRHGVVCITGRAADGAPLATTVVDRRHQALIAAVRLGLLQRPADGPDWLITRVQQDLALVHTQRHGRPSDGERMRQAAADLVRTLPGHAGGGVTFFAGLSVNGTGGNGLRQLAAEAQAAARIGRARDVPERVTDFRPSGIAQVLADLGESPVARPVLEEYLAPIRAADGRSPGALVRTVAAYLDHGDSRSRAAQALHLHPNAVKYRLDKVLPAIGDWLTDPDDRLMVHLACRLWVLEHDDVQPDRPNPRLWIDDRSDRNFVLGDHRGPPADPVQ